MVVSTDDDELRSHSYQVLRRPWEITGRDDEIIRSLETMNPCSLSVIYKWHERFRNGRKSMEDGFEGWFSLGFENDYEGHHFLARLAKTLIKHDV